MQPSPWEEYQQLVELFRYYLELAAKTLSLYWLVAGGVTTLVFANSQQPGVKWALVAPMLLGVAIIPGLVALRPGAYELRDSVQALADELQLRQRVHAELVVWSIHGLMGLMVVSQGLLCAAFVALPSGPP